MAEKWVLVVEDNEDDERLTTRAFKVGGRAEAFRVCRDGEEAIEMLKGEDLPHLILLDLKLPRLDGVEVLTAIRDDVRTQTTPIVVLTSSDERTDVAACYALGCNAFVRKPIDYDAYLLRMTNVLKFWLDDNVPPPRDSVIRG